ncbi:MAG TPA: glutamate-1-semialdehyde 2,1-aminomutase [bacterium]|nr:glutamate-1-semialdehyde 2,1-aminomutase [bacterium]
MASKGFKKSQAWFDRAQQVLPGGVDSPVRAYKAVGMTPPFIQRGKGSRIFDVDGNEYIDYVGSWGPLILGHGDERVSAAIHEALREGASFGAPTAREVLLGEEIRRLVPSVERVRFVNSGNEAAQGAIRLARGFTGRSKIIKFAGCYHGSVDALLVKAGSGATTLGIPDSAGVPPGVAQDTLVARFNDLQSVLDLLEEYPGEVAAILVEFIPGNMGVVAPDLEFLRGLRAVCDREGALLIGDEVMTGFRVAQGGAQALFEVTPDLSIFAKIIGGGLPVGAYGGAERIMRLVAPLGPVYQAGTLSGNPVAMAAGLATLQVLADDECYATLARRSQALVEGLQSIGRETGVALQTTYFGGMLGFFFSEKPVRNYEDALACDLQRFTRFFRGMLMEGIYLAPSAFEAVFMSLAHSDADVARTLEAARKVLRQG